MTAPTSKTAADRSDAPQAGRETYPCSTRFIRLGLSFIALGMARVLLPAPPTNDALMQGRHGTSPMHTPSDRTEKR